METRLSLHRSPAELIALLGAPMPPAHLVPGLTSIARHPERARDLPGAKLVLDTLAPYLAEIGAIPLTTYTLYREFHRIGERRGYQAPYSAKRARLNAAAFQVLLGDARYVDVLHDYMWAICEETNWVIPAHENREIDLTAVATGFALAEIVTGLGDQIATEVSDRVRAEIERRIFAPYLARHESLNWYRGHSNWNGVCNGGIGAMFLLLEPDVERLAQGLSLVLDGLEVFFDTAFEAEGGSTEGTSYWQYGLSNVVPFAEMLRIRTRGAIDVLDSDRLRAIATYPTRTLLSPGRYANFADCEEVVPFGPGLIARLAERTGVHALREVLAAPASLIRDTQVSRFHNLWRNIAWWDGARPARVTVTDVWARDVGMVRLTARTPSGAPVVLAAKAGHNGENHNQNDVGSYIVHVDGESLICEPGRGLYSRDYFGPRRYENVFANSYGHSVPRIDGQLQSAGAAFRGEITAYEPGPAAKRVRMAIDDAYDLPALAHAERSLTLSAASGELLLEDQFSFSGDPLPVEEAFVTWYTSTVAGSTARIAGERHALLLQIERPAGAAFRLEVLSEASAANAKETPLMRLSFDVPADASEQGVRVRATIEPI
ncbi:MAG: heparinase II/III family protein [Anaerolineae bacterium]|nr:heparinase II/III family protein [Anaerolineae bacterium]